MSSAVIVIFITLLFSMIISVIAAIRYWKDDMKPRWRTGTAHPFNVVKLMNETEKTGYKITHVCSVLLEEKPLIFFTARRRNPW